MGLAYTGWHANMRSTCAWHAKEGAWHDKGGAHGKGWGLGWGWVACIPLGVASQNLDQRVGHSLEVLPVERDDLDLSRGLNGRGPFGIVE